MTASPAPFVRATGHAGFRDDKYYQYTPTTVTVMAGWPRMLAWQKTRKAPGWRMLRPDCGRPSLREPSACGAICYSSGTEERSEHCQRGEGDCVAMHSAWTRWSQQIPYEIRELVGEYRERHWHLLSLAARCGEPAIDLMKANPALAWALASSWVFREKPVQEPMRAARRLLGPGKSQRDILAWLGFPSSSAARRVVRKLRIRSINVHTLFNLREAMRDPDAMQFMAHLPALNHGVLRLLADPELRPFCTANFLADVLAADGRRERAEGVNAIGDREDGYAQAAMTLRDCLGMLDFAGIDRGTFQPVRSLADLEMRHDRLLRPQLLNRQLIETETREPLTLPPPPLLGTTEIQPLSIEAALGEEGALMHHCVGSYGARVAQGNLAIYRVLAPERATVAIGRKNGRWHIVEMRLACNKAPSAATIQAVERWLRSAV